MQSLVDQVLELLEDYRAVGEQVWEEAEERARVVVGTGVRDGHFADLGDLDRHRESLTRHLVLDRTVSFLQDEGFPQEEIDRVMTAQGHGFTEADLANLEDGIMPERETIEAFRVRALLAHYALVCDAAALSAGLVQGDGA